MAVGHSVAVEQWSGMLEELLGRVAGRFGRVKPRRRVRGFARSHTGMIHPCRCFEVRRPNNGYLRKTSWSVGFPLRWQSAEFPD